MIDTGGFVLLFGWLIFVGLLAILAGVVLRKPARTPTKGRHRGMADKPPANRGSVPDG